MLIDPTFQMQAEFEIEAWAEQAYSKLDNSYMNGDISTYEYAEQHDMIYWYIEDQYKGLKVRNLYE